MPLRGLSERYKVYAGIIICLRKISETCIQPFILTQILSIFVDLYVTQEGKCSWDAEYDSPISVDFTSEDISSHILISILEMSHPDPLATANVLTQTTLCSTKRMRDCPLDASSRYSSLHL